jgi:hypothetical protein
MLADKATRAACDMRTILRRHNLEEELTLETRRWILKHDKEDADRIAIENAAGIREEARKRGLRKLTLEERRALGL